MPLEATAFAKIAAHWLTTGLPLTLLSPVLALLFNLPEQGYVALMASLAIGTPAASAIGAIGAGLTMSIRRGGLILPLLVLPLLAPAVIFGAGRGDRSARRARTTARCGCYRPFHLPPCCWRPLLRPRPCGSISRARGPCLRGAAGRGQ